jgi:ABC-type amino acid transport substrate-binding protein
MQVPKQRSRFSRWFGRGRWLPAALAFVASAALAVPELDVEIVIGRPRPRVAEIGYTEPEVFNPITDRNYQGGYRYGGPPVEIPQEVRYLSAIGRVTAMKRIIACTDAWYYPFAHTAPKSEPPGIDIEILAAITKKRGWEYSIVWANTGVYRGGLAGAFRQTIDRGHCDLFLGLIATGEDDHMVKHKMAFTRPYLGVGFVLVSNGKVPRVRTLAELKGKNITIGVPAYTPMYDNAVEMGIPVKTYFQNNRVIDGLLRKEVDAIMVWSASITVANREKNVELSMVPGFEPTKGQRFNASWGVKSKEDGFLEMLNQDFAEMLANGEIRRIVEKYDVPFFAPFPDAPSMQ